jgi:hypothetical protein
MSLIQEYLPWLHDIWWHMTYDLYDDRLLPHHVTLIHYLTIFTCHIYSFTTGVSIDIAQRLGTCGTLLFLFLYFILFYFFYSALGTHPVLGVIGWRTRNFRLETAARHLGLAIEGHF